ncbi:MAG: PAS domain-containing sensor histidine kinase [Ramlibacter sp.]
MPANTALASWFGLREVVIEDSAFVRLWRGFMTARVMIALLLLVVLGGTWLLLPAVPVSAPGGQWPPLLCVLYLAATIAVRVLGGPRPPGQTFDAQWASTIGVDLVTFFALHYLQAGGINYVPLFALPLLLASVLSSLLLALGTAAAITLLLLIDAWQAGGSESTPRLVQAGLTGTGFFIVALLANQLATRLAREEKRSRESQHLARVQIEVNELVIETLADGVLVVDSSGTVHAANPAARRLLGAWPDRSAPFVLASAQAWQPLAGLARQTFMTRAPQTAELDIAQPGEGPRRVHVRTRLTATHDALAESLCVMFLQDLREMEARLRTEKLAAMGRMSAAVAHEIRNPLAAIMQANALLEEDIREPAQHKLTLMVRQNAQRLAQIVDDVLNISRVQHEGNAPTPALLDLSATVRQVCADWSQQAGCAKRLRLDLDVPPRQVAFEPDHLRRVLVNLLDNALRYASQRPGAICVLTDLSPAGLPRLRVWSDGAPLDQGIQRHLFEPFFSSESRSSGLGLYICRELCERHGALIGYQRAPWQAVAGAPEGNEFFVLFHARGGAAAHAAAFATIPA